MTIDLATFRPGDVLATHSPSCAGRVVRLCTGGRFDHLAILAHHPDTARLVVFEAWWDDRRACLITGKKIAGFQARSLGWWLFTSQAARVKVYHVPLSEPLGEQAQIDLSEMCVDWCYRPTPYDYIGAIRARRFGGRWLTRWVVPCKEDATRLFCSEAVATLDRMLGLVKIDNPAAWPPGAYVREARRQGARQKPRLLEGRIVP